MPRIADTLERESRTVDLAPGDFERLLDRRERKQRNRRIGAGVLGVLVALATGIVLGRSLFTADVPVGEPTPTPPVVVSGALTYALDGDIYVADPDGSNAVKIASGCNQVPSWSPDGRYLAFEHGCSSVDLMVTDPQGNVVTEFPRDGWGFEWSPDSTRIAVWARFARTIDIYGMDGERQASLQVPRAMAPHSDSGPGEWMADGSALDLDGMYILPIDGSVPYEDTYRGQAFYSPDGTRVVTVEGNFVKLIGGAKAAVSMVRGTGVDAWSPDGDRFAVLSNGELSIVDVATASVTPLPRATAALHGDGAIIGVRGFSPEGDRILYESGGEGADAALWSIDIDGSDAHLVVSGTTQGEWRSR